MKYFINVSAANLQTNLFKLYNPITVKASQLLKVTNLMFRVTSCN